MHVYADNAATTRMHQTAIDTMTYHLNHTFGNPSSLYTIGQEAKEVLETARADMAACFGAQPREIYFTSGGSEADNQAIISAARYGEKKGKKHIITTAFEHHAVLHTLKRLEKQGYLVRSTSPYDKRIRLLTLTAEGRAILEKLSCVIETYQERVTQTIPEADLATFSATLNQIACRLRNIREEDNKI